MKDREVKKSVKNKKEVKCELNERQKAGLTIIFIAVIFLIIAFFGAHIWLSTIDFGISGNNNNTSISGGGFNAEITDNDKNMSAEEIFENIYYNALDKLSQTIAHGNTWLEICPNSQVEIDGEIYMKICSDKYNSIADIEDELESVATKSYIENLIGKDYIDKDGALYIRPISIDKDERYIEMSSYLVKTKKSDEIIYSVKSKYGDLGCSDSCDYFYKEHKFSIVKENGVWLVSEFEMPY